MRQKNGELKVLWLCVNVWTDLHKIWSNSVVTNQMIVTNLILYYSNVIVVRYNHLLRYNRVRCNKQLFVHV